MQAIVEFALNTGMRLGEILDLKWQYVDINKKVATIMRSKNGERRTVPLNRPVMDVIMSFRKVRKSDADYVFASRSGTRLDLTHLRRDFVRTVKKSGIDHFRFHDLRYTVATRLVQAGVDLYTVAKLLGHKDVRMTQRYAHNCPESLRYGMEIL